MHLKIGFAKLPQSAVIVKNPLRGATNTAKLGLR